VHRNVEEENMRILVVGASGTIGSAVVAALTGRHEVLRASRRSGDVRVDLGDPASVKALYAAVGALDAVVACAGAGRYGSIETLSDDDFAFLLANKLMGQVNLVRFGIPSLRDGGSFTLTAGIFSQQPSPGASGLAMVNGALESFGRAAALDLPRGLRVNVISPPWIKETAAKAGQDARLSAADNALAYVQVIEGTATGAVIFP
jgi:NAD(P)-dependent dehydrogenase (short-subunit alcohol dehydrogenase family)